MAPASDAPQRRPRPTGSRRVDGPELPRGADALRPNASPRSIRGTVARDDILNAARVVFARMGYGGARFEDIAAEAGTSRTSVYHYFSSRRELFIEVGRSAAIASRAVINVVQAIPDQWRATDLDAFIDAYIGFCDAHGTVVSTWTQATWDDRELRDVGLAQQLRTFEALGKELARLRGAHVVDPVNEGILVLGMMDRLWFYSRNGGSNIDDAEMKRSVRFALVALLRRRR